MYNFFIKHINKRTVVIALLILLSLSFGKEVVTSLSNYKNIFQKVYAVSCDVCTTYTDCEQCFEPPSTSRFDCNNAQMYEKVSPEFGNIYSPLWNHDNLRVTKTKNTDGTFDFKTRSEASDWKPGTKLTARVCVAPGSPPVDFHVTVPNYPFDPSKPDVRPNPRPIMNFTLPGILPKQDCIGFAMFSNNNNDHLHSWPEFDYTRMCGFTVVSPTYDISGIVFVDSNQDGNRDPGEPKYNGATITLSGASSQTVQSSGGGQYDFPNLPSGTYTVTITVPAGYTNTSPTSETIALDTDNLIDFGISPAYTISGAVFNDVNKNGIQDPGEPNYNGSPNITSSRGNVTTKNDGTYTISNLTAGQVTVSYPSVPSGYKLTYPLNGPPSSYTIVVGPGCNTNGASGATCQ